MGTFLDETGAISEVMPDQPVHSVSVVRVFLSEQEDTVDEKRRPWSDMP